ncbi:hypothetical protein Nans01_28830 [Nocardiopsis ansamitocini]|uniref:Pyrrolidone-carboxylate peptidase n=2 Tax=Nocardiopsis ansamitocini TaxID=1670832 RepID=A0A9W6P7N9_9ACTN|nr:hypothetical protein Nans01_28830 [Nocardiopsis ansamitocini]
MITPLLMAASPAAAGPGNGPRACLDHDGATVEEARVDEAAVKEILERSGFDAPVREFTAALCKARTQRAAEALVERHGERLWRSAVDRVQDKGKGKGPKAGSLSAGDDRPLYWARLSMTGALNNWSPGFALSEEARADLVARMERSSRGYSSLEKPARKGVTRIVVTGFDPFRLDNDIRQGNPSGAAALALDGTRVETGAGTVVIETAMFPVRWRDFTDGIVEEALLPAYTGRTTADAVITVSQGRAGRFDLEAYNGAWRAGSPDNEMAGTPEQVPVPRGVPTVRPQPQWTESTLPHDAVIAAWTGVFPVYDNTQVTEIPAGSDQQVARPDGPTEGSTARSGGGGNYLSNEIAYRNTLLRDGFGSGIPAGHVHTPILSFGGDNTDAVSDPVFEQNRTAIVDQVAAIVEVIANETVGD